MIPDGYDHWYRVEPYTHSMRTWLQATDHYLGNAPPGAMFAVAVRTLCSGLFGAVPAGELLGVVLVGRPIARMLPQDGTVGQILRMWLAPGLPHGTASEALRFTIWSAAARGIRRLITYHDRSVHTGCCYRKAGFRRAGVTRPSPTGWASRSGRRSHDAGSTSKRCWVYEIAPAGAAWRPA